MVLHVIHARAHVCLYACDAKIYMASLHTHERNNAFKCGLVLSCLVLFLVLFLVLALVLFLFLLFVLVLCLVCLVIDCLTLKSQIPGSRLVKLAILVVSKHTTLAPAE